jgi:hypothetical protein
MNTALKNLFASPLGRFLQTVFLIIGVSFVVIETYCLVKRLAAHIQTQIKGDRS